MPNKAAPAITNATWASRIHLWGCLHTAALATQLPCHWWVVHFMTSTHALSCGSLCLPLQKDLSSLCLEISSLSLPSSPLASFHREPPLRLPDRWQALPDSRVPKRLVGVYCLSWVDWEVGVSLEKWGCVPLSGMRSGVCVCTTKSW